MQKIERFKIQKYGKRGFAISIPNIFKTDNNLSQGDIINIFRTEIRGRDALVLIPEKEPNQYQNNS